MEVTTPPEPRVSRGLIVLGLATAGLVSAAVLSPRLAHLVLARSSDRYDGDVPFSGWQVDVAETALGVLLLAVVVLCVLALRREWIRLRGHTPYLRVPILLALLPSVALGGLLEGPLTSAVSWTADRTTAAHQARAAWEREVAEHRLSPTIRLHREPAPASLARLLLRPADLGSGWYDAFSPNPVALRPGLGERPFVGARSTLVRTHREGLGWSVADPMLSVVVTAVATPAAAQQDVARRTTPPPDLRNMTRSVHGVRVTQLLTPRDAQGEVAGFAIGSHAFVIRCDGMPGSSFDALVDAAVRRALGR